MGMFEHYLNSIFASAVCTAMVMYALTRRRDGTRRLIFAAGAAIVVPVIVIAVAEQQAFDGMDLTAVRLVIALPAWLAIVAVTFAIGMGWMGMAKRVGDHPHCRKCGFDLFGKPEASTRCGECGAELGEKNAVVIGVRVRRYQLIAASLFLFFLGLLIGGRPVYQWAQQTDWETYKPMWWLISDLSGRNPRAAQQEIARRFSQHELSVRDVRTLIDYAAKHPSSTRGITFFAYYPLMWMNDHDDLDEAECRRLIQSAGGFDFMHIVPKLSRGMPVPVRTRTFADFFTGGNFAGTTSKLRLQLAGIDLGAATNPDEESTRLVDPGPLWSKIPDGPTVMTLQIDAVVHFRSHGKEFTEPVTTSVSCPTNVATGAASEAPSTRPKPADLAATWQAWFGMPRYNPDPSNGLRIEATNLSTRVVAHVILIDTAGRQDIGMVEGTRGMAFTAGKAFRQPVGPARLELVPAPEATRNSWDQSPFLDQTITINQVTVE